MIPWIFAVSCIEINASAGTISKSLIHLSSIVFLSLRF